MVELAPANISRELMRDPANAQIVEDLKSENGDKYARAMQQLAHLAQDKFGVSLTELNLYDGEGTTNTALQDTPLADIKGGAIMEEGYGNLGDIFVDATDGDGKKDMVDTLGHELIESVTALTGAANDAAQEDQAVAFGGHFAGRIDQAFENGLDSTTTGTFYNSLTGSMAVQNGTRNANAASGAEMDNRQLGTPELGYVQDSARVERFGQLVKEVSGEDLSHSEAQTRLLRGAAGLMDQQWQETHGEDPMAAVFLMEEIGSDIARIGAMSSESESSSILFEQDLRNSELAYQDPENGESRLLFSLNEGEFENERHGLVEFMSPDNTEALEHLLVPKTNRERSIDFAVGHTAGQEQAMGDPIGLTVDALIGAKDFVFSPIDSTKEAIEGIKESGAHRALLQVQGRDYELGYQEGYDQGAIAVTSLTGGTGAMLGKSILPGAMTRARGGNVTIGVDAEGQFKSLTLEENYISPGALLQDRRRYHNERQADATLDFENQELFTINEVTLQSTSGIRARADISLQGQPNSSAQVPQGFVATDILGNPRTTIPLDAEGRTLVEIKTGGGSLTKNQRHCYPHCVLGQVEGKGNNAERAEFRDMAAPREVTILIDKKKSETNNAKEE